MSDVAIRHAWSRKRNCRVWACTADRREQLECPDCQELVIVRRGSQNAPHFAHYPDSCCLYFRNTVHESDWHREAKYLLAHWLARPDAHVSIRCTCARCYKVVDVCHDVCKSDTVKLEWSPPHSTAYRADIAVLADSTLAARAIFEVCHTHSTTTNVRPEPWYEMQAQQVCRVILAAKIANRSTIQLDDCRHRTRQPCIVNETDCCSMTDMAKQLGYLQPIDDVDKTDTPLNAMRWVAHSCTGSVKRRWVWSFPNKVKSSFLWTEFLQRQRCIWCGQLCQHVKMFEPYCKTCKTRAKHRLILPRVHCVEHVPLAPAALVVRRRTCASLLDFPVWTNSHFTDGWICAECDNRHKTRAETVFYYGRRLVCHECVISLIVPVQFQLVSKRLRINSLAQNATNRGCQKVAWLPPPQPIQPAERTCRKFAIPPPPPRFATRKRRKAAMLPPPPPPQRATYNMSSTVVPCPYFTSGNRGENTDLPLTLVKWRQNRLKRKRQEDSP